MERTLGSQQLKPAEKRTFQAVRFSGQANLIYFRPTDFSLPIFYVMRPI
jgi:hypothetical protein